MVIKVLGTGCPNCKRVKALAADVLAELDVKGSIEEVTDIPTIMSYGVMSTPGIVIDEQLVGYGGVPSRPQMVQIVKQAAGV